MIAGCTLGDNWSGFPSRLAPDYVNTSAAERLDVELPLYVQWVFDTNISLETIEYDPPKPITDPVFQTWFGSGGFADYKIVDIEYEYEDTSGDALDRNYTTCAERAGLEAPTLNSFPITPSGALRVTDVHGGIASKTTIRLKRCTPHQSDDCAFEYSLLVGWDRPKTHFDDKLNMPMPHPPGTVYQRRLTWFGPYGSFLPVRIVQWVSADIAGTDSLPGPSPRIVDAADLAALSQVLGQPVSWGFDGGPPRNYHANLAPSNDAIDSSDLAAMASDLGKSCSLAKAGSAAERDRVMDWFGYALSGREVAIGPNGTDLVPEYVLVDPARHARALADPYGYQRSTTGVVREVPWGSVKQLYR